MTLVLSHRPLLNGNRMKKLLSVIVAVLFVVLTFAQGGNEIETVNGKKYYVHVVEKGQTLYSIHQQYNVSVDDIKTANANMGEDLQIGERLLIPIPLDNNTYYGTHVVEKGQTLYGISKQYKCSVSDLKNLNPELENEGIQIGQVLKVPLDGQKVTSTENNQSNGGEQIISDPSESHVSENEINSTNYSDSIIVHTVLKHETLYSISKRYMVSIQSIKELNQLKSNSVSEGDQLKIKVKKVNYEIVENPMGLDSMNLDSNWFEKSLVKKESYKVALFLPLMLAQNNSYMNKPLRLGEVRELYPLTKVASDFYHGFVLAADSLAQAGLNVEIFVYDTKKDSNTVKSVLSSPNLTTMDMIVGPFYTKTLAVACRFAKENHIPLIIPFKSDTEVLYQNPFVFKATASNLTLTKGMMTYIAENHSQHHVTILKPSNSSDLALFEQAKETYNTAIKYNANAYSPEIKVLSLGSSGGRELNASLKKDTVNIVVVPSTDLKFITGAMVRLNNVLNMNPYAKKMKIIVFGYEDWNNMDDIDLNHRMRMHQHYASYRFLSEDSVTTNQLYRSFRNKYDTDPDIYGVQGFDVGYYFLSAMYLYGQNYPAFLYDYHPALIQNDFQFDPSDKLNGKENQKTMVVEYLNYELIQH